MSRSIRRSYSSKADRLSPRQLPILAIAVATALLPTTPAAFATVSLYSGTTDGNYQNPANWGGTAPGFNTTLIEGRLNINSNTVGLNYTAAEGNTILDISSVTTGSSPANENRAIVVGSSSNSASGTLNISGGSLTVVKDPTINASVLIGAGVDNWAGTPMVRRTRSRWLRMGISPRRSPARALTPEQRR